MNPTIKTALAVAFAVCPMADAAPVWTTIDGQPEFSDVRKQLQTLVDVNGTKRQNKFCVIGQKDGRYRQAYVYWPTENKLILWIPHLYDNQALITSKRYLDLARDVVPGDDVHGSTYLLTRSDANATIHACRTKGDTFIILKSAKSETSLG